MRVLITGHSGFLGSWLSFLLNSHGHEVFGYSSHPGGHCPSSALNPSGAIVREVVGDIRDKELLRSTIKSLRPDFVVHLAAEAIVQTAASNPAKTLSTNALGTLTLLDSLLEADFDGGLLVSTTDKVYKVSANSERAFIEDDQLGGLEPYSASKVIADIAVTSYANSLSRRGWNVFRAGNILGGGDRGAGRLLPSALAAHLSGEALEVRNPESTRPWQHVSDCAKGIYRLMEYIRETGVSESWNLGPQQVEHRRVSDVLQSLEKFLPQFRWVRDQGGAQFVESRFLGLDSSKLFHRVGWCSRLSLDETVELAVDWEMKVASGERPDWLTAHQLSLGT